MYAFGTQSARRGVTKHSAIMRRRSPAGRPVTNGHAIAKADSFSRARKTNSFSSCAVEGGSPMRTLIIGATVHAGFATAQRLRKAGHEVTGLARNAAAEKKLAEGGINVAKGDLASPDSVISILP